MSCGPYLDLISARLDGELTLLEDVKLKEHLRQCSHCRAIAEDLKGLKSAAAELETVELPADFTQRVMERVWEERSFRKMARRQRFIRQAAGLAACLLLFAGVYVGRSGFGWQAGSLLHTGADTAASGGGQEALVADYASVPDAEAPAAYSAQTERDAVTMTTSGAGSVGAAEKSAGPAKEPSHYFFCNDQYIPVCYGSTPQAPSARILGSVQELTDFAAEFAKDDLSEVTGTYGEEYFKNRRLLAVVVEENSGSVRHEIESQGLFYDRVVIRRIVPEVGTCDMAAWLILAEVDTMFSSGRVMTVELIRS